MNGSAPNATNGTPSRPVSVYDNLNRTNSNRSISSVHRHSYGNPNHPLETTNLNNPGTLTRKTGSLVQINKTDSLNRGKLTRNGSGVNRSSCGTLTRLSANGEINGKKVIPEGARSPTQEHLLRTTVPQRIVGSNFGERHTPTRNSLRHSRMIVMHKTVPRKSLPPIIRYHRLAKVLVTLKTLLGIGLCLFAMWLLFWTPNMRSRDNPYWSALPLLVSGIFGIILICSCKKEYPKMPGGYCVYSVKVLSVFLSTVSSTTCFIATTFALIHILSILTTTCLPFSTLTPTCVCNRSSSSPLMNNSTTADSSSYEEQQSIMEYLLFPVARTYHYVDLTCDEVGYMLLHLVIVSAVLNFVGGVLAMWYVWLHWASRYYYTYSKVRTNKKELRPIVIRNDS